MKDTNTPITAEEILEKAAFELCGLDENQRPDAFVLITVHVPKDKPIDPQHLLFDYTHICRALTIDAYTLDCLGDLMADTVASISATLEVPLPIHEPLLIIDPIDDEGEVDLEEEEEELEEDEDDEGWDSDDDFILEDEEEEEEHSDTKPTLVISTSQHQRTEEVKVKYTPANEKDFHRVIEQESRKALIDMGFAAWDSRKEKGQRVELLLFPHEWFAHIPNGFVCTDIFWETLAFDPESTDDDMRFGALSFGIVRNIEVSEVKKRGGQRHD